MGTLWWKTSRGEWQARQRADGASTATPVDPIIAELDVRPGDRCPKCRAADLEELIAGGFACPNCGFAYRLAPCT
jgi:hypothetical protein